MWRRISFWILCKPYYNDDRVKQNSPCNNITYYTIAYTTYSSINTRLGRLLYIIVIIICVVSSSPPQLSTRIDQIPRYTYNTYGERACVCASIYGNRSTWEKVISPMNFSRPILLCAFRIKTHTRQSDFLAALVCLYKLTHTRTVVYVGRRRELKEMCCRFSVHPLSYFIFFLQMF